MTHLITVPPELVREWNQEATGTHFEPYGYSEFIATRAAQWGADQELQAVCQLLFSDPSASYTLSDIRAARRPKPLSLKEQALQALSEAVKMADDVPPEGICSGQADIIRRALEQIDD